MTDHQLVRKLFWVIVLKCIALACIWVLFFSSPQTTEKNNVMDPTNPIQMNSTGEHQHGR